MLLNFVIDDKDEYIEAKNDETLGEILSRLCEQLGLKGDYAVEHMDERLCETTITMETKIFVEDRKVRLYKILKSKYSDFPNADEELPGVVHKYGATFDQEDSRTLCDLLCLIRHGSEEIGLFMCMAIKNGNRQAAIVATYYDINIDRDYFIDDEHESPLELAVRVDDIEVVMALVNKGIKMDYEESYSEDLMYDAIRNNNLDMIKLLIRTWPSLIDHYNVEYEDITPIMYSIQFNRWNIFIYLLDNGAKVDSDCDGKFVNAIDMAAKNDDESYLEELTKRGFTKYCYFEIARALKRGDNRACERLMDAHTLSNNINAT